MMALLGQRSEIGTEIQSLCLVDENAPKRDCDGPKAQVMVQKVQKTHHWLTRMQPFDNRQACIEHTPKNPLG